MPVTIFEHDAILCYGMCYHNSMNSLMVHAYDDYDFKVTGTRVSCNNWSNIHASHAEFLQRLASTKCGAGLEPIQTRLLLNRQTSCRGVATWTP